MNPEKKAYLEKDNFGKTTNFAKASTHLFYKHNRTLLYSFESADSELSNAPLLAISV